MTAYALQVITLLGSTTNADILCGSPPDI